MSPHPRLKASHTKLKSFARMTRPWIIREATHGRIRPHTFQYTASIVPGVRETLDKKALIETYGEKAIAPFIKKTGYLTVKLTER